MAKPKTFCCFLACFDIVFEDTHPCTIEELRVGG
jgi:hypothetical protein